MSAREVIVVGGGLAGITAALDCADAGCQVTLVEARGKLGGLTHSFRRGELDIDNGQHVFLRCCTAYRELLVRLGVQDLVELQERLDIPVRSPGQPRTARLRRTGLPAPLHLGWSLLRHPHLGWGQRLRFMYAALAMRRLDRTDPANDQRSLADWLADYLQDAQTVAALWDLIGVATLNARSDEASLAQAAMVFQVGLLTQADAADIGWALVPLQRLHGDAAVTALRAAGATVRTGAPVLAVEPHGGRWRVRVRPRAGVPPLVLTADDVVLALPPIATEQLAPVGAVPLPAGWSARLGASPIVNVHVVLDRPVLDGPFLAGAGTPIQWIFDRTRQSGLTTGQYLAVSLSAADDYLGEPVASLRARLLPELAALLPEFSQARVRDFFVTREPQATFRPTPGTGALRPGPNTAAAGLYLAGAWTDTGWPATMEGAVRSGRSAAAALLARADRAPTTVGPPASAVPGAPPRSSAVPDTAVGERGVPR
jgi:hydroxysqualene dehydroxylase